MQTDGVWTRCLACREPVCLIGTAWHHEHPADHEAQPDLGVRIEVHA